MKNILYVHGAASTPLTFNYIKQNLPEHNAVDFIYNSNEDIQEHVQNLVKKIAGFKGELDIISHSLGGVIAVGASYDYHPTLLAPLKIVTMSSPFGGSRIASYLKWLYPGYGLFDNVSVTNPLIIEIQERGAVEPTLNIITTAGDSPLIREANDGIVSVSSQLALEGCEMRTFRLNHFEVLLSPEITEEIRKFLWDELKKEEEKTLLDESK